MKEIYGKIDKVIFRIQNDTMGKLEYNISLVKALYDVESLIMNLIDIDMFQQ